MAKKKEQFKVKDQVPAGAGVNIGDLAPGETIAIGKLESKEVTLADKMKEKGVKKNDLHPEGNPEVDDEGEDDDVKVDKAVNKALEKRDKQAELQREKAQKEEELRLTELDVNNTYKAARQLFENGCDYLKKIVVPVHNDHPLLKEHGKILLMWIEILEKWSAGVGVGYNVDWESIDERIAAIRKATESVFKEEKKYKDDKINPLIEEVKDINKKISDSQ